MNLENSHLDRPRVTYVQSHVSMLSQHKLFRHAGIAAPKSQNTYGTVSAATINCSLMSVGVAKQQSVQELLNQQTCC